MKKAYQKPHAKKVTFNFEKVIATSGTCGSGIVLTNNPGTQCGTMTPSDISPYATNASINPNVCGWQTSPNG